MNTIYVVTENEYDYDSSSSIPILATFTKAKAEAKVAEMLAKQAKRVVNNDLLIQHMNNWDIANPRPNYRLPTEKAYPNYGPQRNKWSKEQIAEYDAVKQSNKDKLEKAVQPVRDWTLERMAEQKAFITTFPADEQGDWYIGDKLCWEIEDVPYEE
jgi:hypothetical protein